MQLSLPRSKSSRTGQDLTSEKAGSELTIQKDHTINGRGLTIFAGAGGFLTSLQHGALFFSFSHRWCYNG